MTIYTCRLNVIQFVMNNIFLTFKLTLNRVRIRLLWSLSMFINKRLMNVSSTDTTENKLKYLFVEKTIEAQSYDDKEIVASNEPVTVWSEYATISPSLHAVIKECSMHPLQSVVNYQELTCCMLDSNKLQALLLNPPPVLLHDITLFNSLLISTGLKKIEDLRMGSLMNELLYPIDVKNIILNDHNSHMLDNYCKDA